MINKDIKTMVGPGKIVEFQYFREGVLYYQTECGFLFKVPVADTGTTHFPNKDRAMLFMKWIRKDLKELGAEDATG